MSRTSPRTVRRTAAGVTAATIALALAAPAAQATKAPSGPGVVDHPVTTTADDARITLQPLGSYATGVFDESAAEIVAYHARSQRLFSVNAQAAEVTVPDVADPAAPRRLFALQTTGVRAADGSTIPDGAVANSVAVRADGLVVVAVESAVKTDAGWLVWFDATGDGAALGAVRVGALPDMVTIAPDGRTAVVANEGDAREWGDYADAARVEDLGDDGLAPVCDDAPAAGLLGEADLGRLEVSTADGLRADGSCYDELYSFGGRSFSIWTPDGEQVFDSGDDFEQITADVLGEAFNTDHGESGLDKRSDAKGPEPEAVAVGKVAGRTYAFVGLERASGIMVYDVTVPADASFVTYVSNRDYSVSAEDAIDDGADPASVVAAAGDLGPEGMTFIPQGQSPTHMPLLAVANEVSGTTTLFEVDHLTGR